MILSKHTTCLAGIKRGRFRGDEISIKDSENVGNTLRVNVFELDPEEFGELETIANQEHDFKSFIRYLRAHNLPHIYNHSFWFAIGDRPTFWAVPELIKHFLLSNTTSVSDGKKPDYCCTCQEIRKRTCCHHRQPYRMYGCSLHCKRGFFQGIF